MALLDRRIYFGTKERMVAIRAPRIDYDSSRVGWDGGVTQLLNGGAYVRRSTTGHKTYSFSWSGLSRDEIRLISDYAEGVYGDGAIYFIDPFAMNKNLLPQHWATPRLAYSDALTLTGQDRASMIYNPVQLTNNLNYPQQFATYTTATGLPTVTSRPRFYLPIPPDYTAWFGSHGNGEITAANSLLQVTTNTGTVTNIPQLTTTTDQRFSNSWDGTSVSSIEISMTNTTGTATPAGMMLQLLPTGTLPTSGGFISGQGHSGTRFASMPTLQNYSAALDMTGLTAQLVEDDAWR